MASWFAATCAKLDEVHALFTSPALEILPLATTTGHFSLYLRPPEHVEDPAQRQALARWVLCSCHACLRLYSCLLMLACFRLHACGSSFGAVGCWQSQAHGRARLGAVFPCRSLPRPTTAARCWPWQRC